MAYYQKDIGSLNLNLEDITNLNETLGAVEKEKLKRTGLNSDYALKIKCEPSGRLSATLRIITITKGRIETEIINFI